MIEDIEIKKRKLDEEGGRAIINVFTFFAAVNAGNLSTVKQAIEFGINVNSKDRYGDTALIKASDGTTEILKSLLESGADVDARDCREATALMYASEAGHIENVKLLIERGARVDLRDMNGQTALVYALMNPYLETTGLDFFNHLNCIDLLLDHDPTDNPVDDTDINGRTDLIHAAYSLTVYPSNAHDLDQELRSAYQIECVKLLINMRPPEDDMSNNFTHKLIRKNMNEDLKAILLPYVDGWFEQCVLESLREGGAEHIKPTYAYRVGNGPVRATGTFRIQ